MSEPLEIKQKPEPTHKEWKAAMEMVISDMKCREQSAKRQADDLRIREESIRSERHAIESILYKAGLE